MNNVLAFNNTQATMSSIEIAQLTEKQHKNVLADIRKMLDELGISSAEFSAQYNDPTGRSLPCFNLPRREVEILVTGYSIPLRAKVIDRLHELEQQAVHAAFNIPTTLSEALLLAGQLAADKEKALAQIAEDKPKVDFVNAIESSKNAINIGTFAKLLGIEGFGQNKLFKWLREKKILIEGGGKHNQPYQRYIENGWFEIKEHVHKHNEENVVAFTTLITGKGQVGVTKLIKDENVGG